MNFKYWFVLSEELYQNNTATVFHRTKSFEYVQQMMKLLKYAGENFSTQLLELPTLKSSKILY